MHKIDYTITLDHDIGLFIAEAPEIQFAGFGLTAERALWELLHKIDYHNKGSLLLGLDLIKVQMDISPESRQVIERGINQYLYFKAVKHDSTTQEALYNAREYSLYFGCPLYSLVGDEQFPNLHLIRVKDLNQLQVFESRVASYIQFDWQEISQQEYYDVPRVPMVCWRMSDILKNRDLLERHLSSGEIVENIYYSVTEAFLRGREKTQQAVEKQVQAHRTMVDDFLTPITAKILRNARIVNIEDCIDVLTHGGENALLSIADFTDEMLSELKQRLEELGYLPLKDG